MDWKKWRSEGLGASDAPIVMGVSPWKTRYQLWEEKCGLNVKDDGNNWATRRGNDLEPKARAHYELLHTIDMPVAFVQHKDYPFIRASLDGYNEEKRVILEIKCPGKEDHEKARVGEIPDKYWPQVQHQLLATGADYVHYYSFDGESGHLVIAEPDPDYIDGLFKELCLFWELVQTRTPPDLGTKDFKTVRDKEFLALVNEWRSLDSQIAVLAAAQKKCREEIIAKLPHPNVICGDLKIFRTFRKGNVDYGKIPQLEGVDLEQFRKVGSLYYTFKNGNQDG